MSILLLMSMAMLVLMFSLAGVPPMVGFFGKFYVLKAAVDAGWVWLAVAGAVASVIGAFYYLRIIKVMYFDAAEPAFDVRPPSVSFVAGVGALVTTLFFIYPAPVIAAAQNAARVLFG